MGAQLGIRPGDDLAAHARPLERYAGRLDARALREAIALPRARAKHRAEDVALWYIPFLAAILLSLLAVAVLTIWALL